METRGRPKAELVLSDQERVQLTSYARSRSPECHGVRGRGRSAVPTVELHPETLGGQGALDQHRRRIVAQSWLVAPGPFDEGSGDDGFHVDNGEGAGLSRRGRREEGQCDGRGEDELGDHSVLTWTSDPVG